MRDSRGFPFSTDVQLNDDCRLTKTVLKHKNSPPKLNFKTNPKSSKSQKKKDLRKRSSEPCSNYKKHKKE